MFALAVKRSALYTLIISLVTLPTILFLATPVRAEYGSTLSPQAQSACWSYASRCAVLHIYGGLAVQEAWHRYPGYRNGGSPNTGVQDGTRANTFQHCYWNALMQVDIGMLGNTMWGYNIAKLHEDTGSNPVDHRRTDKHNNFVGLHHGYNNPFNPSPVAGLCVSAELNSILYSQSVACGWPIDFFQCTPGVSGGVRVSGK